MTNLTDKPDFSKGEPLENEASTTGSGMFTSQDDQGTSYYFRGDKTQLKNNVKFGGQNWKIVRINGDGSIRLILADETTGYIKNIGETKYNELSMSGDDYKYHVAKVGFTYNNNVGQECTHSHPCEVTYSNETFTNKFGGINSHIKLYLENWYKDNLNNVDSKIEYGSFCNDTSMEGVYNPLAIGSTYYGPYFRFKEDNNPNLTFKCPDPKDKNGTIIPFGGVYKTKIGLLTTDETIMAGYDVVYDNRYHIEGDGYDIIPLSGNNYLYNANIWWSISPYVSSRNYDDADVFAFGSIYSDNSRLPDVANDYAAIPVINLKSNVQATGTGTAEDPFVIK